jgi:hypothetical protein
MMALFSIVVFALATAWEGYVLSVMWAWFVVPMFDAPAMNVPTAVGIAMAVAMLTHQINFTSLERLQSDAGRMQAWVYQGGVPATVLLVGWIAKWWMR